MKRLTATRQQQNAEAAKLDAALTANLLALRSFSEGGKELGHGG